MEASSSVIPLDATQAAEIVDRIVANVKRVIHAPDETLLTVRRWHSWPRVT